MISTVDPTTVTAATGVLLAFFNLLLVGVTLYYAQQTRRMVLEMREARRLSVLPKLTLNLHLLGTSFGEIAIRNVGQGPALDADVELTFEPAENSRAPVEHRRWRTGVIAPGEQHRFFPPRSQRRPGQHMRIDEMVASYSSVRLSGRCRLSLGESVNINEVLDDLAESWELMQSSMHEVQEDPAEKVAQEAEKARMALEKQAKAATMLAKRFPYRPSLPLDQRVRRAVDRLRRQASELAGLVRGRET